MSTHHDVIVSGAGLVGGSVALGLADLGFSVALIEPKPMVRVDQPDHDRRTLVLNAASLNILNALDVLPDTLARVPVTQIDITRQGGLGHLHLNANDFRDLIGADTDPDHPYFGQVVVAGLLAQAIDARVQSHPNITFHCPDAVLGFEDGKDQVTVTLKNAGPLTGDILVGADGNRSAIRQALGVDVDYHDYGQSAMVFNCQVAHPQPHTAFERFTPQGPLALLPQAHGRYGVVWIDQHAAIDEAMAWSDEVLLARLQQRFGPRLGAMENPSPRSSYPLIKQHSQQVAKGRVVLVGNAANAVHPVSAQGLNLGLRDVAGLIDHLKGTQAHTDATANDGMVEALRDYQRARANDQRATVTYTDTLARTFAHPLGVIRLLAGLGLAMHAATPSLQRRLVRHAMGFRQPSSTLASPITHAAATGGLR